MPLKEHVNRTLSRLTGYQLTRVSPATTRAAAKPAGPALPKDYDDDAVRTITDVKPWTMTSPEKLNALILAVRHVVKHQVPGDVVECGVWRGGSMQATARTLMEAGDTSRNLYLFDTFEGMPPPTEEDLRQDGRSAADLLAASEKTSGVWAVATLEDVRAGMGRIGYPDDKVHFVPGLVEETVPDQAPEQIAVLRLDTDWYASTKHELDHLYDRVPSGGVVIIDDYDYWEGSRKAVDEFVATTGARLLLAPMGSGRIAVKP